MARADRAAGPGATAQRLLQDQYAQEKLTEALENLRAAYRRGSKRRVRPVEDKKVREHVRRAGLAAREAAKALQDGGRRPRKRRGRRILVVLGLGGVGAAVALAADENLRKKVLGEDAAYALSGDKLLTRDGPGGAVT